MDRTLRASEVGQFRFCERSWWYAQNGRPTTNANLLQAGTNLHREHARASLRRVSLRRLALALIVAGAVLMLFQYVANTL